jgi:hypothetical protein
VIDTDSFTASLGIAARTDVTAPMPLYIVDLIDPRLFKTFHFGEKLKLEGYGFIKLRDRVLSPHHRCGLRGHEAVQIVQRIGDRDRRDSRRRILDTG